MGAGWFLGASLGGDLVAIFCSQMATIGDDEESVEEEVPNVK